MFNRWIAIVVIVSILSPLAQAANGSSDIQRSRYATAFAYLASKKAVGGNPATARPYDQITRAEALKVLLDLHPKYRNRVDYYRTHASALPLFTDVSRSDWFNPYIEVAYEADLLSGYPNRTFRPGRTITLEEAVALLARAYGFASATSSEGKTDWYSSDMTVMTDRNVLYRREPYAVGLNITRGQFFDMVYRLDYVQTRSLTAFADAAEPEPVAGQPVFTRPVASTNGSTTTPTRPPVGTSGFNPVASRKPFAISIPKLNINDLTVTHPSDALSSAGLLSVLKQGVGHLFAYPGGNGKIMIYGHSSDYAWNVSNYSAIFARINKLQAGDQVFVTFNGRLHTYEVTRQQVIDPNDVRPFTGAGEELILYTCWPVGSIKSRLIVHAKPIGVTAVQ